jgi:hypothetical protein
MMNVQGRGFPDSRAQDILPQGLSRLIKDMRRQAQLGRAQDRSSGVGAEVNQRQSAQQECRKRAASMDSARGDGAGAERVPAAPELIAPAAVVLKKGFSDPWGGRSIAEDASASLF